VNLDARDEHGESDLCSGSGWVDGRSGRCQVFVSYSHVDEAERVRLDVHLAPLVREGLIDAWCNRAITPGSDWERDIRQELATADIVILLVTANFVASVFCIETELAEALRRHAEGGVRILPVIVKPVDFANMSFGRFQALPRGRRPISTWENKDLAWLEVARGVRDVVEDIYRSRSAFPSPRPSAENSDKSRLGQELRDYYGTNCCVVDGSVAEDRGVEWIPLDGDSQAMTFDNMVPISARHRVRPLRHGTELSPRRTFRFGIDLIAEYLFHSARRHFHSGMPELAFGCVRLGDTLAVNYPYAFEAHEGDSWAFLALSLFYLPYRMHDALLAATLRRVRSRVGSGDVIPAAGRSALLLAIGNLYQDAGNWADAERLYGEILRGRATALVRAATLRRRAVGRLFVGASHEMDRDFRSISVYRTNDDLDALVAMSEGWWHLARGLPERCLRALEPFDFDEESPIPAPMYSSHTAIEFKLTQASALAALGLTYRSQVRFVSQHDHARLRPVFTEYVAPLVLGPEFDEVLEPLRQARPTVPPALDETAAVLVATSGRNVPSRPIWVD
jgi:TIR domain-containing protein